MCDGIVCIVDLPFAGFVILSPGKIIDSVPVIEDGYHLRKCIVVRIDTHLIQIGVAVHQAFQQGDIIPVKCYVIFCSDFLMVF